jgi:UDP-N-acetylmuramoyl-L-alanyl-D-glutamate--2,6-diaminopimelate ligase
MEVSSHAIVQHRITGLEYTGGIFTNLTHDHLDFHLTFRAYLEAKKMFFDNLPASAFALVNIDDKNGSVMVQNTKAGKHSFALKSMATFKASILEHDFSGMQLTMNGHELWTLFIGRFNAYNLLGVYGAACLLEVPSDEALRIISVLQPVDGRFEVIRAKNGKQAIVDYAHTPDALQNVLTTIREARKDSQRIITVAGAGGDRDKLKRPEMARVAASLSDILILTSDNPRSEDPEVILNDMEAGLATEQRTSLYRIADRRSAIRTAIGLASPGDIILVAGKGHETYQEIKGVKHDFDDKLVIQEFIHI